MAVLTWRNVDAPDFRAVTDAYRLVVDSINKASTGMIDAINSYQEGKTQSASSKLMLDAMKAGSAQELKAALQAGVAADPRYLSSDAVGFLAKYSDMLNDQDIASQKLALAAARGTGGGGRSGRGGNTGKEDMVDVNGKLGINGYIDESGAVTATPVAGVDERMPVSIPATPAKRVVVPAAPLAQEQSAITAKDLNFESAAAEPVNIPAGGPTLENAEQFTQSLGTIDSSFGAPVRPGASGGLMSVPGPIRVGNPKGKDGGNQRNSELQQDLINSRLAAVTSGDPTQAIQFLANAPRVQLNMTATNGLDLVDNTIKAAQSGQDIQEKGYKLRGLDREEQDTLEARNRNEIADGWIQENITKFASMPEVQNAIPRDDPKLFATISAKLNDAAKVREFDTNVPRMDAEGNLILPSYLQQGTGGGELPVSPEEAPSPSGVGTVATDEAIAEASATPEGAAQVAAKLEKAASGSQYFGRKLDPQRIQYQSTLDQIKLDTMANPALPILADYEKNASSTKSDTDVAQELIKKNRYEGATVADVAAEVRRVRELARVNPAVAGRILENAARDPWMIEAPFRSIASRHTDNDKVAEYVNMFVDEEGNPRRDIVQQAERVRGVNDYQKKLDGAWSALQKAQSDLDDVIKNKGVGIGENTNTRVYEAAVKEAQKQFDAAVAESKKYGFQNRGSYPEVRAQPTPEPETVIEGQVRDLNSRLANAANQTRAAEQIGIVPVQVIYNDLLANFKGNPTETDKRMLLKRAREIANGRKVSR